MDPEPDVSILCCFIICLHELLASSSFIDAVIVSIFILLWNWQEGAELEEENNNEDLPDPVEGDGEEKQDQVPVDRPRKTSKYMTKYERARILGTRALQIRFGLNNLRLYCLIWK